MGLDVKHERRVKNDLTSEYFGKMKLAAAQIGMCMEEQIGVRNREFVFGHVKFAMPIKYLSGALFVGSLSFSSEERSGWEI